MMKFIVAELMCGSEDLRTFGSLAEVALCHVPGFDMEFPLNGSHCSSDLVIFSMNWIVEDIILLNS
jgi:hypothetical protein